LSVLWVAYSFLLLLFTVSNIILFNIQLPIKIRISLSTLSCTSWRNLNNKCPLICLLCLFSLLFLFCFVYTVISKKVGQKRFTLHMVLCVPKSQL
jgi:hypothetical protein